MIPTAKSSSLWYWRTNCETQFAVLVSKSQEYPYLLSARNCCWLEHAHTLLPSHTKKEAMLFHHCKVYGELLLEVPGIIMLSCIIWIQRHALRKFSPLHRSENAQGGRDKDLCSVQWKEHQRLLYMMLLIDPFWDLLCDLRFFFSQFFENIPFSFTISSRKTLLLGVQGTSYLTRASGYHLCSVGVTGNSTLNFPHSRLTWSVSSFLLPWRQIQKSAYPTEYTLPQGFPVHFHLRRKKHEQQHN